MNYFSRGILDREREMALARPSVCITRKMTHEELMRYGQGRRPVDVSKEAVEFLCHQAEKNFIRKCRKVRKTT